MTLIIQKPTGAKLNLRKGWQPMDADAAAYITAVETADGQALEEKTKIAIDNFVLGCKADGIWTAIKASCILAGARTLEGALVPMVGAAPTNVGGLFVAGDYNRKTGLVGNGSTKYLSTNRNNTEDPQDNKHISVFKSASGTTNGNLIGTPAGTGSWIFEDASGSNQTFRINSSISVLGISASLNFIGCSRNSSSSILTRASGRTLTLSSASAAPSSLALNIFAGPNLETQVTNARLAFYSIGESLNLALLDARVTDLINAFGAAIP
jgi:hypothetical protein